MVQLDGLVLAAFGEEDALQRQPLNLGWRVKSFLKIAATPPRRLHETLCGRLPPDGVPNRVGPATLVPAEVVLGVLRNGESGGLLVFPWPLSGYHSRKTCLKGWMDAFARKTILLPGMPPLSGRQQIVREID